MKEILGALKAGAECGAILVGLVGVVVVASLVIIGLMAALCELFA